MSTSAVVSKVVAAMVNDKWKDILINPEFVEFSKGKALSMVERYTLPTGAHIDMVVDEVILQCRFRFDMVRGMIRSAKQIYAEVS